MWHTYAHPQKFREAVERVYGPVAGKKAEEAAVAHADEEEGFERAVADLAEVLHKMMHD